MFSSFWKKQLFRLFFGLLCAVPLLIRSTKPIEMGGGERTDFDAHRWAATLCPTLVFIVFILPLLRCGVFFRFWKRYAYFRRACCMMLVLRLFEAVVAWNSQKDLWLLDGFIMWASFPFSKMLKWLGQVEFAFPSYLEIFAWGMGAYIVLWAVIGLLFYFQVLARFIRTRRWEYK